MNKFNKIYTDETKSIMISSFNRISNGTDGNCIIPMGNYLNNDYEFYHCQVIDFYGDSVNIVGGGRLGNLVAFDFMEQAYNSNDQYNGQTIVSSIIFNSSRQYRKTEIKNSFIVKNFNNKQIRFAITKGDGDYSASDYGGIRNWVLLLALTPMKDTLQDIYYISSKKYESFTYCFSSNDFVSGSTRNRTIRIPAISSPYEEFWVDVTIIQHTRQLQTYANEFMNMWIDDWSDDYPSQFIGCLFCAGNNALANIFDSNKASDNAVFKIKNMKQSRLITVKLLDTENNFITSGSFLTGYTYSICCLITPIR